MRGMRGPSMKSTVLALILAGPLMISLDARAGTPDGGAIAGSNPVEPAYLARQGIPTAGSFVRALRVVDTAGEHVLVLSRKTATAAGRTERIELFAAYHTRRSSSAWNQEWTIRDMAVCPELDIGADFFLADVALSDIDKDGIIEVAVPYYLQCAGGVEPRTVKIVLREGANKLAIRGESQVRYPGQEHFGGEHKHDKALLDPANKQFKQHLDNIWKKVSIDARP